MRSRTNTIKLRYVSAAIDDTRTEIASSSRERRRRIIFPRDRFRVDRDHAQHTHKYTCTHARPTEPRTQTFSLLPAENRKENHAFTRMRLFRALRASRESKKKMKNEGEEPRERCQCRSVCEGGGGRGDGARAINSTLPKTLTGYLNLRRSCCVASLDRASRACRREAETERSESPAGSPKSVRNFATRIPLPRSPLSPLFFFFFLSPARGRDLGLGRRQVRSPQGREWSYPVDAASLRWKRDAGGETVHYHFPLFH